MRYIKFLILTFILMLVNFSFQAPQPISANVPSGFFEVGTDFQIGTRWVRFINNANDMSKLSSSLNSNAIFIVNANIDMAGRSYSTANNFSGNIYGFGHTISNLRFNGNPLIANSSSGVIEWLHFENIEVPTNTNNFNSLLVGTNSGTIRNVSYSVKNTTDVLSIVPPLVSSNSGGVIENIIGSYDLDLNHQLSNAQPFTFNGVLRSTNNTNVRNIWLKGDINITRSGIFTYQSMPSLLGSSDQACADTININVITHGNINVDLSNCFYSSEDREFNLGETAYVQNYATSRLVSNELLLNPFFQAASNPRFPTGFWRLNDDDLIINRNTRLGIAGRHPIEVRNHIGSLTTVNLYRTPVFNSELLPLSFFTEGTVAQLRIFNEEVRYSTNYSRVLLNESSAPRSGVIPFLGDVDVVLESDYGLPTLRARVRMTPITNIGESQIRDVGFIPTTSLGTIVDQDNWSWNDSPITTEGDYLFRIFFGNSQSDEFPVRIRPIISGINNNAVYTNEVTPLITAASVLINDADFENGQRFSAVGHYDVVFPNLTPANIRFTIAPNINLTNNQVLNAPRQIRIPNNIERLFINNFEVNEEFLETYSDYVTFEDDVYTFNPSFGSHRIRIEGINDFNQTYNFNVEPSFNITEDNNNHKTIEVTGGLLLVDDELVTGSSKVLNNVGNYQLKFQIPQDAFALNAGEVIIEQQEVVSPRITGQLSGTFDGSVEPNIQGDGMTLTLNTRPIELEDINQVQDRPGAYNILIQGKDDYSLTLRFEVRLVHNIDQDVYYNRVPLDLSSPNNFVRFLGDDQEFDYTSEVINIGRYQVFTYNINDSLTPVASFEIAPFSYDATVDDFLLTVNVNQLHPHVDFHINDEAFGSARQNLTYDRAGRYELRFENRLIEDEEGNPLIYKQESLIIEPRFNREIRPTTNVVESYRLLNEVELLTINGRTFSESRFNEDGEFFINQNGLNVIQIRGVNGEIFVYESFFENPHYANTLSLMWPAIIVGVLSAISIAIRFLGVYRNES